MMVYAALATHAFNANIK